VGPLLASLYLHKLVKLEHFAFWAARIVLCPLMKDRLVVRMTSTEIERSLTPEG
jgi:hypothetical protein